MFSAVVSAIGTVWSLVQGLKSSSDANKPRTPYDIPEADFHRMHILTEAAQGNIPGYDDAMAMFDNNFDQMFKFATQYGNNPEQIQGQLPKMLAEKNKGEMNLNMANAEYKDKKQSDLVAGLSGMAGQEEKKQMYDTILPEQANYERATANESNAIGNAFNGLKSLSGGLDAMKKKGNTTTPAGTSPANGYDSYQNATGMPNTMSVDNAGKPQGAPFTPTKSPYDVWGDNTNYNTGKPANNTPTGDDYHTWLKSMFANIYPQQSQQSYIFR